MRFDGQTAQHCNCHLLCMKATLCASNETLALCTSIHLFTPVDTYVPKNEYFSKGVCRLAQLPSRNQHYLEVHSASGSIASLCLGQTLVHSLEYFCGSSVCIFLDLCVWEQQEAICSFMQERIGPAKFLLLHRPIQSFKYKSLQALYFPYVPPKVPVLTFISQGLPQTHPHLPQVHASITPPFCISTVRWRTNPNLIYRVCFFRVHIHSSSEVRFNHMHISFSSMSNTYACGF